MKKALVTGGAGFIGSAVVRRLLADGWCVSVLDDLSTGYPDNLDGLEGVTLHRGDVRDRQAIAGAVDGASVVLHLAAEVGNIRSIENPIEDATTNLVGTIAVLEAARLAGVRRVVVSSSSAIFGELQTLPIAEDHPLRPDSPYGVSKLAAEKVALCYAKLHGLTVAALRYFNVYGVRQRYDAYGNVIPIFCERLLRREPLTVYGDGHQSRDFVNVRDVAEANFRAATMAVASAAYNLGSGRSVTILELIALLGAVTGRTPVVRHADRRPGEVLHSRADISAAQAALGFSPSVDLETGLREYWDWKLASS